MKVALLAAAAVAVASPAFAGTTTFSDSNMIVSDYTVTTHVPGPSFITSVYQGGDPGGGTSFATSYATQGSTSPAARFWALSNSFVYDPSTQGAITSIDAALDQVVALYYNNAVVGLEAAFFQIRLLAEQDGQLYRSRSVTSTAGIHNTWLATSTTGVGAGDFLRLDAADPFATPTQQGLNFAGGAIRFGFELAPYGVTVGGGPSTGNTLAYHWVDNLQITLNTQDLTGGVPEPATWAMMIVGFGLAGSAVRRRRAIAA